MKKKPRKKKLRMLPLSRPSTPQDIVDRAQRYGPACLDTLADVAANGSDAARVSASNSLLERGFGKVGQTFEFTGSGGGPVAVELGVSPAVAELIGRIREAAE